MSSTEVARLFSPYRLQVAREAKGLSRTLLSTMIDVSAPAISQFEKGSARPKPATLDRLAEALGFPVNFFSTHTLVGDTSRVDEDGMDYYGHFRSLRSISVTQRRQSLTVAHLLRDVAGVLDRHVQLPNLDLPKLVAHDPIEAAERMRSEFGLARGPVDSVLHSLESRGIVCARFPFEAQKVSALSVPTNYRVFLILRAQQPPKKDRDRFSASHELGHLVMHQPNDVLAGKHVEKEADIFASEFLMPRQDIVDELPSRIDWPTFLALKQRWGVSLASLLRRAHDLEKIPKQTYVQALKTMSARGWRLNEPGDLGPAESPQILSRAVELAGITADDIAAQCGWPPALVASLLDLNYDTRPALAL